MSKEMITLKEAQRQRKEWEDNVLRCQIVELVRSSVQDIIHRKTDEEAVISQAIAYGKKIRRYAELGYRVPETKQNLESTRCRWYLFLDSLGGELREKAIEAYWIATSSRDE